MSTHNLFIGDPEFCPQCGTLLPLPGETATVSCRCCEQKIDVKKFDGITVTYEISFDNKGKYKRKNKDEEGGSSIGPLVDRDCSKCGNQGMAYTTMQTRSADEGQTVFYACPRCDHREHEHS